MRNLDGWIGIITALAPILIAVVTIIPTVISNRKKTQASMEEMQAAIISDINDTKRDVLSLRNQFDEHVDEYEVQKAKQARYRILRFYDELCLNARHSESHFEDILDDVDYYEQYCNAHPDFRNSRGRVAMDYIRETYHRIKARGGFLTHEEDDKK